MPNYATDPQFNDWIELDIEEATDDSPIVLTLASIVLYGDGSFPIRWQVYGCTGNTAANGNAWEILETGGNDDTVTLVGSTGNGTYAGGGKLICQLQSDGIGRYGTAHKIHPDSPEAVSPILHSADAAPQGGAVGMICHGASDEEDSGFWFYTPYPAVGSYSNAVDVVPKFRFWVKAPAAGIFRVALYYQDDDNVLYPGGYAMWDPDTEAWIDADDIVGGWLSFDVTIAAANTWQQVEIIAPIPETGTNAYFECDVMTGPEAALEDALITCDDGMIVIGAEPTGDVLDAIRKPSWGSTAEMPAPVSDYLAWDGKYQAYAYATTIPGRHRFRFSALSNADAVALRAFLREHLPPTPFQVTHPRTLEVLTVTWDVAAGAVWRQRRANQKEVEIVVVECPVS